MGDHLEFKGKTAYVNFVQVPKSREDISKVVKYDISFDSLDDLQILLNMGPDEIITLGDERMLYSRFRSEILERAHRIYPIKDGKLFDMVKSGMDKIETLTSRQSK